MLTSFQPGRPRLLGIVNVTPDSFSDGGRFLTAEQAVEHGLALLAEGADALDLGAESTRPGGGVYGTGARTVPVNEELDRLLPVLVGLRRETSQPLSVDTRKAAVAREALAVGADIINDVSALGDPEMGAVVAAAGCAVILMHSRGELGSMQRDIVFTDVVAEVAAELDDAAARALAAGIAHDKVIVDPGLGFGKTAAQNLALLRGLPKLVERGRPVLVGASRKSFLGAVTGQPPAERLEGSLAAAAWAAQGGAAILRVHDVAATRRFLEVWAAIADAVGEPS
ncbi:MAG: dihydropteroate synthase [Thermoanaerobaculia bacterium]|nr:dihydropteroate synthase [Thermoanaerobaculia bacterium]